MPGGWTLDGRARRLALGVGLCVVLGALSLAAPAAPTTADSHPTSSAISGREFTTAPSVTRPTRSLRVGLLAALLTAALTAALAVWNVTGCRPRPARRRIEQFFARRRGPPVLLVAH